VNTTLFRAEALHSARQSWLGPVQVVQPPPLRWGLALAVAALLALAALLSFGSYTRKAAVPGTLVPSLGLMQLTPAAPGTVLERPVAEGQPVQAGDLLFVLALDHFSRDDASQGVLEGQRRSLAEAARQQQALAAAREAALARRLEALAGEGMQLAAEAALQQRRLVLARQSLERLLALRGQGFVSDAQLQTRQEEVLALEAQVQSLVRQQATLARERAELEGERRTLPALRDSAVAQVGSQLAEAERDGAGLRGVRRIELRAPAAGTVHALTAEPGQAVAAGVPLGTLLPAGATLQAELSVPGRAMGPVQAGQPVRLRLEAFPQARFGALTGRIARIDALPLPAAGDAEPRFRLIVALDPLPAAWAGRTLRPGLTLEADLLLERRPLWQWAAEPLLRLQNRL
jgi:membrane fusion protein